MSFAGGDSNSGFRLLFQIWRNRYASNFLAQMLENFSHSLKAESAKRVSHVSLHVTTRHRRYKALGRNEFHRYNAIRKE